VSAWDEWREETFGTPYLVWHDGIDPGRFGSLPPEARQRVLALLPAGIGAGDWLAAVGVRMLGAVDLVPLLEETLAQAGGRLAVEAARAVIALGGDRERATAAVLRARFDPAWSERMAVVIGMRHIGGDEMVAALLEQVAEDSDYLVRYHAAESLLHLGSVEPTSISEHREIFDELSADSDGDGAAEARERHRKAAAALAALVR
jgi:HEAT repeat protein